ncbi:MAG: right-handed parallel beta-helix repeat-containing protein [Verrucomicrobiota bacterium]
MRITYIVISWLLALSLSQAVTLDISNYGAIANDGVDDLAAIQSAIQNANQNDSVFIPSGTWQISGAIVLKDDIQLVGAGVDKTIIRYIGTDLDRMINIEGTEGLSISGFTLSGENNIYATHGIAGGNAESIEIKDLRIRDFVKTSVFGPSGIYFTTSVRNSSINGCEFIDIGLDSAWGAAIRVGRVEGQTNNSSKISIFENTISGTGRGGILIDNATDVTIQSNSVTGSGQTDVGLGIEVFGGSDRATVEDNVIDHWLSIDRSTNVAVRRNTVSNKNGPVKSFGLEAAGPCENTIFVDNIVDQGAHIGISVSNSGLKEHLLWIRNTVSGAETWGGQIQGESAGAFRMYFRENIFKETESDEPNLFASHGHGLRINGNVSKITFDQNTFADNDADGIQIRTENSTTLPVNYLEFLGNTFSGNEDASVAISSSAESNLDDLIWTNNTVVNNDLDTTFLTKGFAGTNPPVISIVGPTEGFSDKPIQFEVNFTDDGTPVHYLWDLATGLPATDSTVTAVYKTAGTYRVSLAVWDNDDRAAYAEHTIKIYPQPIVELITSAPPIDAVRINFNGTEGYEYLLQSSFDLSAWTDLESFSGAGNKEYLHDGLNGEMQHFYRVEVED